MISNWLRAPLNQEQIISLLGDSYWRVSLFESIPSTQIKLTELSKAEKIPVGTVFIADHQSAGRGRLTRTFETPPKVALLLSTVLYPIRNSADLGWIPLIVGVATANAISKYCGLAPLLKWPNDLLIGDLKVGGIIAEQIDDCVVVGIGINVLQNIDELPVPTATSLLLECEEDVIKAREELIAYLLQEIRSEFDAWNTANDNVEIRKKYSMLSATIGKQIKLDFQNGDTKESTATGIAENGGLLISSGETIVSADITHLRAIQ
jgi:BirA family transcriptional regulator, biotin operon repressor / biotin---[acetyl-CoA-carboxylase] ligase